MTTYNYKISGNNFTVVCEYWQTSRAWGHLVTVLKNGEEVAKERIRYYNRTWESFTYQTAICNAIEYAKKRIIAAVTDNYKVTNNYKVLTAGRRADLAKLIAKNQEVKQYTKLYNNICTARHGWF